MQPTDSTYGDVAVMLTPSQAREIADSIRIELASRWDGEWLLPVACREDIGKARSLLDVCGDHLEQLQWGEPAGNVELRCRRDRLEQLAHDLIEGAAECLDGSSFAGSGAGIVRDRGRNMIDAAHAINEALHKPGG